MFLANILKAWMHALTGLVGAKDITEHSEPKTSKRKAFLWASVLTVPGRVWKAFMARYTPSAFGRSVGAVYAGQRGSVDPAGMMLIAIGLIFLSVGLIIYPIIFDATDAAYAWTSANYSAGPPQVGYTTADFTGLQPVMSIFPLLVLLGFVVEAVLNGIMGLQIMKGQGTGGVNPAALMLQAIGLIFLAVAMIVYPITLDGIATVLSGLANAQGTYTGIASFAPVVPLLVLLAIIVAGVMASFFGIKTQFSTIRGGKAAAAAA